MYHIETRLIMRNIGRVTGDPHFTACKWDEVDYAYPTKAAAEKDVAELKRADDPDTSFCRWEYRVKFVSAN